MNRPCISLLTDFGLQDSYVGQMKGVIASINPQAALVDLTHAIPPQQILAAAVALSDSVDAFPSGTIHLAVVDPGVGSSRRAIAAEVGPYRFVCPDNGLLTLVLQRAPLRRAVNLDQQRWWRPTVSQTFHGRDLFAPIAAAWSLGHDLAEFGSPLTEPLMSLPINECEVVPGTGSEAAVIRGQILVIDRFGNLITNVTRDCIPPKTRQIQIEIAELCLHGISGCYSQRDPGTCIALFGSSGRLEIAIVNGNAAAELAATVGTPVTVSYHV